MPKSKLQGLKVLRTNLKHTHPKNLPTFFEMSKLRLEVLLKWKNPPIQIQNSSIASQVSTKFCFKTQLLHLETSQPNLDSKLSYCISRSLNQILIQNSTIASQDISTTSWFKTQLLHLKKSQPNFDSKLDYCISRHLNQILIQNSTIASQEVSTKFGSNFKSCKFSWVRPNREDSQSQWKETTMLSGYNHKWPKKLNFHLGQSKRLVPFCQMGSVRKDAKHCKLPLHSSILVAWTHVCWIINFN